MKDVSYSRRPIAEKVYEFMEKTDQDCHISYPDITRKINIHRQTVLTHLKRVATKKSSMFEYRNKIESFLKRMITGH